MDELGFYDLATHTKIEEISIYGVMKSPLQIVMTSSRDDDGDQIELKFKFDQEKKTITVIDVNLPILK
jgi:hypothetical protein